MRARHARLRLAGRGLMVAAALAAAAAPVAQRATREARDRHVYISAVDRNDLPVTDLTIKDVVVREDGATRELISVGRATAPVQVALLADDSQAASTLVVELRDGLASFEQAITTSNPDSEVALWTFGERPTRVVDFTPSVSAVTRGLNSIFSRPGAGSYFLEAIVTVCRDLVKKGGTRPIIVAFVVEDSPEFSTTSDTDVTRALKNAQAALWTIVLQGRTAAVNSNQIEQRNRSVVIGDTTRSSGGGSKIILDRTGLKDAYASVFAKLTAQIDVAYARPDRMVPPTKLEVSITRPGVKLLAAPKWAAQ